MSDRSSMNWSPEEDQILINMANDGLSMREISQRLGRTFYSVVKRSERLGRFKKIKHEMKLCAWCDFPSYAEVSGHRLLCEQHYKQWLDWKVRDNGRRIYSRTDLEKENLKEIQQELGVDPFTYLLQDPDLSYPEKVKNLERILEQAPELIANLKNDEL